MSDLLKGTLPIELQWRENNSLKNYRIYGSDTGSGVVAQLGIQLDEPLRGLGDVKDTLDLSTGVLTRRIGVVVLDGTQGQVSSGNTTRYFYNQISATVTAVATTTQIISHYVYASITTSNSNLGCRVTNTSANNTRIAIRSPNTDLDTTAKYRAFYASEYANGRPVTAYYVLADPVTEQVDVPSGLSGTIEGYLTQTGTPTESNPIYPEANGVELPNGKYEVYADVYVIPLLLFTYEDTMPTVDNIDALEQTTIEYTKVEIASHRVDYISEKKTFVEVKSATTAEGFEVIKTGLVLWNSAEGVPSGELTLENAAIYDDIKTGGKADTAYSASISDNGQGFLARGYVTISDGTNTYTKYTSKIVEAAFYVLYIGGTRLSEDDYLDYGEQKIYKRTVQLFNKNAPDNYIGYYLLENGEYSPTSNYLVAYIPCIPGTSYTMSNLSTLQSNAYIGYCDASKNVLGTIANTRIGTADITVTAPNGAAYLAVSVRSKSVLDTAIVVEGSTAADQYYPYYEIIDPPIPLPPLSAYKGENTLSSSETVIIQLDIELDEINQISCKGTVYDLGDLSAREMIANQYNSNNSYYEGDYCYYMNKLYKCTENTSGVWDINKWSQTSLMAEFSAAILDDVVF